MSLGSASRKASRGLSDDARLLPRHRPSETPSLDRRRLERAQATALLETLQTNTSDTLPLRHELTKPGDKQALRGVPLVGAGAGAIWGTSPHGAGLARLSRADDIRERTHWQ